MHPRLRSAPTLALLLLIALLTGCASRGDLTGPDGSGAANPDQSEVAAEMAANPGYVDDEVSEAADPTTLEGQAEASAATDPATIDAAIRPLTFWREIRDVQRRFEFAFVDTDSVGRPTTAIVTVHKLITGTFNILVADETPEGSPPAAHVIHKRLADHGVRRVLLKRVRLPESDRRAWRVVATSGVRITSRDAKTRIESLRVQSGALDTTITDPLAFFRLRAMLKLDPQAEVTLTATTLAENDVVLLYLRDRRARFTNHGDRTYSITFRVPDRTGLHHVGVNALSHGTLFDDQAPYDSQAWIEPYLVHPLELAAEIPN
ncbi:MAG TPA: hypothetical protein VJY35_08555 [Candidatus Eisenbacteria bacterium]|nr:hypothetical protein [Candidatus Eisenbacteria bacterium]